jgi:hypothetical protein
LAKAANGERRFSSPPQTQNTHSKQANSKQTASKQQQQQSIHTSWQTPHTVRLSFIATIVASIACVHFFVRSLHLCPVGVVACGVLDASGRHESRFKTNS